MGSVNNQVDSMEDNGRSPLNYQFSSQNSMVVVSFSGALINSNLGTLEKCMAEVLGSKATSVVLNFRKATKLDFPATSALIRLQHSIREKPAKLRLCFLSSDFTRVLEDRGAIRKDELRVTLVEAVHSFDFKMKN
jgi:MFS superfamily sulfate permease-like transporter